MGKHIPNMCSHSFPTISATLVVSIGNKFLTTRARYKILKLEQLEGIRQYDSSDTGHSDNANIAAEHQEPAEVLSQLDNTSNSPVYGEYKCC